MFVCGTHVACQKERAGKLAKIARVAHSCRKRRKLQPFFIFMSKPSEDVPETEEHAAARKKLMRDANELMEFITIEMTVGGQMDSTRRRIKELTKLCKEEFRTIIDLEKQTTEEERKAEELQMEGDARAAGEDGISVQDGGGNVELIVQLEAELAQLYAERARLIKKQRKEK